MRLYHYYVLGASPGPGVIVVLAKTTTQAASAANTAIEKVNAERAVRYGGLSKLRLGDLIKSELASLTPKSIMYFDEGER